MSLLEKISSEFNDRNIFKSEKHERFMNHYHTIRTFRERQKRKRQNFKASMNITPISSPFKKQNQENYTIEALKYIRGTKCSNMSMQSALHKLTKIDKLIFRTNIEPNHQIKESFEKFEQKYHNPNQKNHLEKSILMEKILSQENKYKGLNCLKKHQKQTKCHEMDLNSQKMKKTLKKSIVIKQSRNRSRKNTLVCLDQNSVMKMKKQQHVFSYVEKQKLQLSPWEQDRELSFLSQNIY